MKQKRKIIVAGVLVLIIACGIYYLTADDRSKTDSSEGWICTKGTENITSIAINSGKDSQTLIFTKEEESWMGDDGSSYDNDRFAPYTATLGYMKVEEKLSASTADEKEEYGSMIHHIWYGCPMMTERNMSIFWGRILIISECICPRIRGKVYV